MFFQIFRYSGLEGYSVREKATVSQKSFVIYKISELYFLPECICSAIFTPLVDCTILVKIFGDFFNGIRLTEMKLDYYREKVSVRFAEHVANELRLRSLGNRFSEILDFQGNP